MFDLGRFFEDKKRAAWLLLMAALALHVGDEAVTGFLPFYNDMVLSLRERWGFFPMPTFTYPVWLGGLITGLAICFLLTGRVARGGPVARALVGIFSLLMIGNALGHLLGSVYFARLLPGFWSSPVVLPAALHMLWRVVKGEWPPIRGSAPEAGFTRGPKQ